MLVPSQRFRVMSATATVAGVSPRFSIRNSTKTVGNSGAAGVVWGVAGGDASSRSTPSSSTLTSSAVAPPQEEIGAPHDAGAGVAGDFAASTRAIAVRTPRPTIAVIAAPQRAPNRLIARLLKTG
jgi:hypothetical protein